MAILSSTLDYSDKDFDSLRARLFNLIGSVFPTWTETQVANFGNMILESFSFVGDVLLKYQDNQARESRWTQATQRKNLIALAKLIGFEPSGATASQADVTIGIVGGAIANDIIIPEDTVVRTTRVGEIVRFRLLAPATIIAGATELAGITAEDSEAQSDTFTSSGAASLEVSPTATPYLDGSAVVSAGNGLFTEVDNFLDSTSTDLHYTVTVDQNDQAIIRFGNGINGAIPTGTIVVDYRTGGGAAGVVEAGTISVIEGFFTDVLGNPVTLTVTNPAASSTAVNRQSIEEIRQDAPNSIRVLNRTVAREDYELNALKLAQVSRALMLTSNEDVAVQENKGTLYIIPVGGGVPSASLKADVLTQVTVTFPNTLTFEVSVLDPLFLTVNVSTVVHLVDGATPASAKAQVEAALAAFFAPENADGTINTQIDFGFRFVETTGDPEGKLPWSDIHNVIRDLSTIRKIDDGNDGLLLNGVRADVDLLLREFPQLGTVTVINAATGTAIT